MSVFHLEVIPSFSSPAPQGHLAICGDSFGCHNWGEVHATDTSRVKARDSAKNPTMHKRTAFHNKDYLAQNVNSAEFEKACFE